MTTKTTQGPLGARPVVLAAIVLFQSGAATYFLADATSDLVKEGVRPYLVLEALVALSLIFGVWLGLQELRRTLDAVRTQHTAIMTASGALAEVISTQFQHWALTSAERDVALLALKGLDVAEIAGLRGAAAGTIRAQLSSVYSKSGLSGRAQFAAFFVEDLLDADLISAGPAASTDAEPTAAD